VTADRPAGCPPWCIADHSAAHAVGYHHGDVRLMRALDHDGCITVHAYESAWSGDPPTVAIVYGPYVHGDGAASLTVPAENAGDLAGLLGSLGHGDLAAMVREVAAEVEDTAAHPTDKEATTS
jgi:hypothetical protein